MIQNEKSMNRLLFYLSYRLNYRMNLIQSKGELFEQNKSETQFYEDVSEDMIGTVDRMNRFRFKLMRVRSKISFSAFMKR